MLADFEGFMIFLKNVYFEYEVDGKNGSEVGSGSNERTEAEGHEWKSLEW